MIPAVLFQPQGKWPDVRRSSSCSFFRSHRFAGMQRSAVTYLVRSIGGASASLLMWLVFAAAHYELALVPFTSSIIMVFGSPDSPLTRPRSLIGGHILCSVVTLIVVSALGYAPWVSMPAVGFAMCLMLITRTLHPPAGMSIFV